MGAKRRNDLLKAFGTVKAIRAADYEQLCAVVPRNAAQAVYAHFHPENSEEEKK